MPDTEKLEAEIERQKKAIMSFIEIADRASERSVTEKVRADNAEEKLTRIERLITNALLIGAHPDEPLFSPRVVLAAMGINLEQIV